MTSCDRPDRAACPATELTGGPRRRGDQRRDRGGRGASTVAVVAIALACACSRSSAPAPSDDVAAGRAGTPKPPDTAEPTGTLNPTATPEPGAPKPGGTPKSADDGTYRGRPVAETCSYLGADWLERPDRAEREQPDRVLDALHLDPRSTVADVGAGTGYFTLRLARRVARVLATDLQPEMLDLLAANAARARLTNISVIRAGEHDAALPPRCCDLILLVDVYHELSDPPAVMAGIRRALTDHGRAVLIEYRGEDPAVPIKPEHKMTLPRIRDELGALGFSFVESLEFLPDQRIVIFRASERTTSRPGRGLLR